MKSIIKKIIKFLFATENNISLKFSFSLLVTGLLFFMFGFHIQDSGNKQMLDLFGAMTSLSLGMWLTSIQEEKSIWEFIKGLFRMFIFLLILICSLNFCLNSGVTLQGTKLYIGSILSYLGIMGCSFYFISKFVDVFHFFKNLFSQVKRKIFNSIQSGESEQKTTKLKAFIENTTAFLLSITGLAVAIKAILEPIINFVKP